MRRIAAFLVVMMVDASQYGCSQAPTKVETVAVAVSICHPQLFGVRPDTVTPAPVGTPPVGSALIPVSLQGRLGAYGTSRDVLLAPVGWACGGQDAANGIVEVTSPDGTEHVGLQFDRTGASELGLNACQAFALVQMQHSYDDSLCVRPAAELVRAVTSELVSFTDPPHVQGAGWNSGGEFEADGLIWYHGSGQQVETAKITCTVSPANHDLCGPILDYFKLTLPAAPAGSTPADIASFQATAGPGDCAIRLNDADVTVVVYAGGTSACTSAKHALLPIGVFSAVDGTTATDGLHLICTGAVRDLSGRVEVWDLGTASDSTKACQTWDLVSP